MGIIGRIIIGAIVSVIGGFMTIKADWMYYNFGAVSFAEKYLGSSGGTRLFYRLLGIVLTFLGFLYMTGLWGSFILWILGPIIGPMKNAGL